MGKAAQSGQSAASDWLPSPGTGHGTLKSAGPCLLPFIKPVCLAGWPLGLAVGHRGGFSAHALLAGRALVCTPAPGCGGEREGFGHPSSVARAEINSSSLSVVRDVSLKSPKNYMVQRVF